MKLCSVCFSIYLLHICPFPAIEFGSLCGQNKNGTRFFSFLTDSHSESFFPPVWPKLRPRACSISLSLFVSSPATRPDGFCLGFLLFNLHSHSFCVIVSFMLSSSATEVKVFYMSRLINSDGAFQFYRKPSGETTRIVIINTTVVQVSGICVYTEVTLTVS